ncbi:MAG: ATP citrate lyase citrate-binding domain-containing protein [Candidatus Diapherotrites archaeon]
MAQKGIRECTAKEMIERLLPKYGFKIESKCVLADSENSLEKLAKENPWLKKEKLVVKPDMLFGKRGKQKLILLNANFSEAVEFLKKNLGKTIEIKNKLGKLTHFIVEPFVLHEQKQEMYVAMKTERNYDVIYFSLEGGIEVEENWDKVIEIHIPVLEKSNAKKLLEKKFPEFNEKNKSIEFISALYSFFADLNYAYLELNPFVVKDNSVFVLDTVAKLDDTGMFESGKQWNLNEFPESFGETMTEEEKYIKSLDEKSGSSLKLKILNPEGRIWTMVAGGGASVIYADTIVDLGYGKEMANYGEYSGDPSTDETFEYAKTLLDLMTRKKHSKGKVLLIGGGIANFTDVAKTFTGIIMALQKYAEKLREHKIRVYVRRGGPNYEVGLDKIRKAVEEINVPIKVFGPETHMTKIVPMAVKEVIE